MPRDCGSRRVGVPGEVSARQADCGWVSHGVDSDGCLVTIESDMVIPAAAAAIADKGRT